MKKFRDILKKSRVGFLLGGVLSFLVSVYAPIELFISSQRDFWFSIGELAWNSLLLFVLLWIIFAGIFVGMRRIGKKAFAISLIVGFTLLLALYVQGNFFVSALPPLDGTEVDWNSNHIERIKSIALYVVIAAALTFVFIKFRLKVLKKVVTIGCAALGGILVITFATLMLTTEFEDKDVYLVPTDHNDFQYSTDKNLIVLVIDAVDDKTFERQLKNYPELKDTFDDFTRYDDALAGYPFTLHSIPFMFSGVWYENEQPYSEYTEIAFEKSPIVKKIGEENYKAGFYNLGEVYFKKDGPGQIFENQMEAKPKFINCFGAFGVIFKMTAIRYNPWDLKRFGYDAADFAESMKAGATSYGAGTVKMANQNFYFPLRDGNPITTTDEKCVRIHHIEGGHVPLQYNKEVEKIKDATYEDNVDACLTICDQFIKRLKESGVYDNSAIVILADHGYKYDEWDLRYRMNPVLLVKGIGDKGDEMKLDSTPVSYVNLADAMVKLMDGASADGLFDEYVTEKRKFFGYWYLHEDNMAEFEVTGRADDIEAMHNTGKEYILE